MALAIPPVGVRMVGVIYFRVRGVGLAQCQAFSAL